MGSDMQTWALCCVAEIHDPGHFFQHMYKHVANSYAHAADSVKDLFSLSHDFHRDYVFLAGDQMNATQQEVANNLLSSLKEKSLS